MACMLKCFKYKLRNIIGKDDNNKKPIRLHVNENHFSDSYIINHLDNLVCKKEYLGNYPDRSSKMLAECVAE